MMNGVQWEYEFQVVSKQICITFFFTLRRREGDRKKQQEAWLK